MHGPAYTHRKSKHVCTPKQLIYVYFSLRTVSTAPSQVQAELNITTGHVAITQGLLTALHEDYGGRKEALFAAASEFVLAEEEARDPGSPPHPPIGNCHTREPGKVQKTMKVPRANLPDDLLAPCLRCLTPPLSVTDWFLGEVDWFWITPGGGEIGQNCPKSPPAPKGTGYFLLAEN